MSRVPASRYWCFGLVALIALVGDLVSKWWVFRELGYPFRGSEWKWGCPLLWGEFRIQLLTTFNQGALFGIGQGFGWLFAALSGAASIGIVYWLFVRREAQSWWLTLTLALIQAGALGNLYDRLHLHGCVDPTSGTPLTGVRDFVKCDIPGIEFQRPFSVRLIPLYHWPVFNFADVFLVTGAVMLTLYTLFAPASPAPAGAAVAASERQAGSTGASP